MLILQARREYGALALGVLLAGLLLGAAAAGRLPAPAGARAPLRLSHYAPAGKSAAPVQAGPAALSAAPLAPPAEVVGAPSLPAALIDRILSEYGSPAAGQGQVFYEMGVRYGIDPAYALAFYVFESHCGTRGVARFTHGIGNIRTTPGYRDYEGYRSYDSYAAGIEDWFKLIKELYVDGWGLRTVAAIVPRYAPAADNNDPSTYIANVETLVAGWRARAARPGA
jgi:hypothetical protein